MSSHITIPSPQLDCYCYMYIPSLLLGDGYCLYPLLSCISICYHLSKRTNCSPGTCSGPTCWPSKCTKGALSGMQPVLTYLSPHLVIVLVTPNGGVSHNACFIHDSCFCPGSGSFPLVKPPCTLLSPHAS